ncbi:MAG: SDR family NAD(P)-dependent oxidoreductase, partial [Dehalococcoidia bacterium]
MKTSNNTILITGGATGIGFALAEAFVNADNRVLICGRRRAKLEEAQQKLPNIQVR